MKEGKILEIVMHGLEVGKDDFVPYKKGTIKFNVEKIQDIYSEMCDCQEEMKIKYLHEKIMHEFSEFLLKFL